MSWDRGDCGYCHKPIGSGDNSYHPDKDGPSFHSDDCWPRERFNRDGTPFVTCRLCGKADSGMWMESIKQTLLTKSLCFTCNFWDEWVERDAKSDDLNIARINGNHYHVGAENSKSGFRGFGGTPHTILFDDGREVRTTNLWYQGEIPERFRDLLPDNAKFKVREINARTSAAFTGDRTL